MSVGKRSAGRELNHDNWNDEEEGEDAGEFKKASEDELQRRVRKVAKRRIGGDSENTPSASPFSNFGGFSANTGFSSSTSATNSSPFGFLSKIPSAVAPPKTNGTSSGTTEQKSSSQIEYLSKVKALNIAVADWIKSHVDDNPLCILTPIFDDYKKYLQEFEDLKKSQQEQAKDSTPKPPQEPKESSQPVTAFSFGKPANTPSITSTSTTNMSSNSVFSSFSFGSEQSKVASSPPKPVTTAQENKGSVFASVTSTFGSPPSSSGPSFSFGQRNNPITTTTFGGLSSTPFSFGNTVQASQSEVPAASTGEEADEEPPKNEFVAVVEDDSLYSKRCKVFVKGAADYADRGVGTIYIKKVDETKVQLIVRADTNLGNILLNIILAEGIPVTRMGKNNVMIVCVPTPDAKPPPTSVLLRVKTGDDADELLSTINKYKK